MADPVVTERDRKIAYEWYDGYGDLDEFAFLLATARAEGAADAMAECDAAWSSWITRFKRYFYGQRSVLLFLERYPSP